MTATNILELSDVKQSRCYGGTKAFNIGILELAVWLNLFDMWSSKTKMNNTMDCKNQLGVLVYFRVERNCILRPPDSPARLCIQHGKLHLVVIFLTLLSFSFVYQSLNRNQFVTLVSEMKTHVDFHNIHPVV
jgi:hypothetical protein